MSHNDALPLLKQVRNTFKGETSKQDYLKKDHPNFSRIIHDYSDNKKGFVGSIGGKIVMMKELFDLVMRLH